MEPNSESFMGVGGGSRLRFNDPRHGLSPSLADGEELMFIRVGCGLLVRSVRISCRLKPQTHTTIQIFTPGFLCFPSISIFFSSSTSSDCLWLFRPSKP